MKLQFMTYFMYIFSQENNLGLMSKNEGKKNYKRYKVSDVRYFAVISWISDHFMPLTSTAKISISPRYVSLHEVDSDSVCPGGQLKPEKHYAY